MPDPEKTPMPLRRRLALGLVVVAVVFISSFGISQRLGGRDSSLPTQLTVNGRTYHGSVRVEDISTKDQVGTWTQVGTVPTTHQPIFAALLPGAAPTTVFVQLTGTTYIEYTLVGGP